MGSSQEAIISLARRDGPSVSNGAPPTSNYFMLDGAPIMNAQGQGRGSSAGSTLGVDGIQEFKVLTTGVNTEYGMAMRAQVVMVSKAGTNQFHRDAFEYLRNSIFDASAPPEPPLLIPGAALIIRAEGTQVAVVRQDHTVHFQKIEIGRDFGDRWRSLTA